MLPHYIERTLKLHSTLQSDTANISNLLSQQERQFEGRLLDILVVCMVTPRDNAQQQLAVSGVMNPVPCTFIVNRSGACSALAVVAAVTSCLLLTLPLLLLPSSTQPPHSSQGLDRVGYGHLNIKQRSTHQHVWQLHNLQLPSCCVRA